MLECSTLTGAIVIALAWVYAGVFCNDDLLAKSLVDSGEITGELCWRMPLNKQYRDMVKGEQSDLKNSTGPWGGCSTAAAYLSILWMRA